MEDRNEDLNTYKIPPNYKQAGTWRSLRIPNLIEGIVIAIVADFIILKIPFTYQFKMIVLILLSCGCVAFSLYGINGERISIFLIVAVKYLFTIITRKTKYHFRKVGLSDVETSKNRSTSNRKIKELIAKGKSKFQDKNKKTEKE